MRLALLLMVCAAMILTSCQSVGKEEEKTSLRIGISLYQGDDTFITLDIQDAKGSQNTQNSQVERFISLDCDALCINLVDRMDASVIIDRAMTADVPVIFFNRQPVEEDMNRWDQTA